MLHDKFIWNNSNSCNLQYCALKMSETHMLLKMTTYICSMVITMVGMHSSVYPSVWYAEWSEEFLDEIHSGHKWLVAGLWSSMAVDANFYTLLIYMNHPI